MSKRPGLERWLSVIALLLPIHAHGEDELGRLFTTPEERQRLDALRQEHGVNAPTATLVPSSIPTTTPVPPAPITVNGVVLRGRKATTVWINGSNSFDGDWSATKVEVPLPEVSAREVPVQLPDARGTVRLKPGSTYVPPDLAPTQAPFYPPGAKTP